MCVMLGHTADATVRRVRVRWQTAGDARSRRRNPVPEDMPGVALVKVAPYLGSMLAFVAAIKVDLSAVWVVAGAMAIIVAQLVAIPRRLRSFWYQEAKRREEENVLLQEQLRDKVGELASLQQAHTEEMAAFAREQQEVRHSLKNEIATKVGELEIERSKRDLTVVLTKLDSVQTALDTNAVAGAAIAELLGESNTLLRDIAARLPAVT